MCQESCPSSLAYTKKARAAPLAMKGEGTRNPLDKQLTIVRHTQTRFRLTLWTHRRDSETSEVGGGNRDKRINAPVAPNSRLVWVFFAAKRNLRFKKAPLLTIDLPLVQQIET
ncbi:hypothetical protein L596_029261 [Steinernema carpocapsae]|uniref:Uncharacterized protein n=1 Tax=Steinernema carpocapsae TaxID=34508 RepID=A0A4U5LU45_STECR|nr:hypothetical protein L596_029261 [Steinernema carpocapsae]